MDNNLERQYSLNGVSLTFSLLPSSRMAEQPFMPLSGLPAR